jgi:uncharacterized oligopeptide transporter (OPT) family protein
MGAFARDVQGVTLRSWVWGFILALVMCSVNTFLTLKVGIIEEGAVVTFLIFMIFTKIFSKTEVTKAEAVMVATMGSAGGSLSFIANFFAALSLAGSPLVWWEMALFSITTSVVGLILAIPMRQLFVVKDPLPWPTAKVAISAIDAVVDVEDSMQPRILGFFGIAAILYVFASAGLHWFPEVSLIAAFGLSSYGVGIAWSPFILGAGYLIGLRVGWGFLVGGFVLLGMGLFIPNIGAPHKFIWPGVMALVTCGLTGLVLNWRTIVGALKSLTRMTEVDKSDQIVSGRTLIFLLIFAVIFALVILTGVFKVAAPVVIVGLAIGGIVFNIIATRAAGETAFNPVRVMGVMLQGVFAAMGSSAPAANLIGAGAAAGSIGQTGVLTQDTFFGRHFKVPAKIQFLGQAVVLIPIALVCAFVYQLVSNTYVIGSDSLPSPVAVMWAAMADIFGGKAEFPQYAIGAMWIGGIGGIVLAVLDQVAAKNIRKARTEEAKTLWNFWPHSLGITLGMILPIFYDVSFFVGAVVLCLILPKVLKTDDDTLNSLAAAGIVGEGVGGLLVAILIAAGILG